MKVTEAAFVGYPVTDVERAKNFYEKVLGLKRGGLCGDIEGNSGQFWMEYDLGNVTLAISNAWPPSGQSGPSVALEVDDLDASIAHLKKANVPFIMEHMESPVCHFAVITDPDGNAITIHKRKPGSAQ